MRCASKISIHFSIPKPHSAVPCSRQPSRVSWQIHIASPSPNLSRRRGSLPREALPPVPYADVGSDPLPDLSCARTPLPSSHQSAIAADAAEANGGGGASFDDDGHAPRGLHAERASYVQGGVEGRELQACSGRAGIDQLYCRIGHAQSTLPLSNRDAAKSVTDF